MIAEMKTGGRHGMKKDKEDLDKEKNRYEIRKNKEEARGKGSKKKMVRKCDGFTCITKLTPSGH